MKKPDLQRRIRHWITIVGTLLFAALGVWLILDARAIEDLYPITLDGPMAVSEMRAVFGGMMLGVGFVIAWVGTVHRDLDLGAEILALSTLGLLVGRVAGFYFEGVPSGTVLNETVFEVVLFAVLLASGTFRRARR